jgi:hypothetical protein
LKINPVELLKGLNELYRVKRMTIAERLLIRQKNDIFDYIAIHFSSIIKTIIVFLILLIVIFFPEEIPFSLFWLYVLMGLAFMIFDSYGIKALAFFISKFVSEFIKTLKKTGISIRKYFYSIYLSSKKYSFFKAVPYCIIGLIFSPIIIIVSLLAVVLFVVLYVFVLLLMIFSSNEVLSLLVFIILSRILPLSQTYVLYVFLVISLIAIYFTIDYRIKMVIESLVKKEAITDGSKLTVGLKLLCSSDSIQIYEEDEKFYVLNLNSNNLDIYETRTKLNEVKEKVENYIRNKNRLVDPEEKDSVEK